MKKASETCSEFFCSSATEKRFSKGLIDKDGTVVSDIQVSLQSKYSFYSLFLIKYGNISTGIFSVNLLSIREKKHYSSTEI